MNDYDQLGMFPDEPAEQDAPEQEAARLEHDMALEDVISVYLHALKLEGRSHHTIKAFRSDLNLLARWAGYSEPLDSFSTERLNRFLHWMLNERDKPCSPKTYARRVTTLKNFFGYLHTMDVLDEDPAAALIQKTVKSKLPTVLSEGEIGRVLKATQAMRMHRSEPDARPHMLVTLLLETGIKKSEAMALRPEHIIRTDPAQPHLWVRYENPKMRYKERRIALTPDWITVYDEYMMQRKPDEVIFDCTARNLEYVLRDVAKAAGVPGKKLSFETLRWTCALTDTLSGMDPDHLREKLGLSRVSWRETSGRLGELVKKAATG